MSKANEIVKSITSLRPLLIEHEDGSADIYILRKDFGFIEVESGMDAELWDYDTHPYHAVLNIPREINRPVMKRVCDEDATHKIDWTDTDGCAWSITGSYMSCCALYNVLRYHEEVESVSQYRADNEVCVPGRFARDN